MMEKKAKADTLCVELVDNWHPRWLDVLNAVDEVGQLDFLSIDADGWLSARHNLLVAFSAGEVVGHLSFHVQPAAAVAGLGRHEGARPSVEAHLKSAGVRRGFPAAEVNATLRAAAERRARALQCVRFVECDT